MKKDRSKNQIVFSTEHGRMCPKCQKAKTKCQCSKEKAGGTSSSADGIVRVGRQTKGRKGKGVTIVTGVPLANKELKDLAKKLKKKLGVGGSVKDGIIEVQGSHQEVISCELKKLGWKVKISGG